MYSPWGEVQQSNSICRGLLWVSTPGHGGLMVAKRFAETNLSEAARKRAEIYANYFCYEEDVAWQIPAFELKSPYRERLLDDGTGVIREQFNRDRFLESLSLWYADYLIEIGERPVEPQYTRYKKGKMSDQMRKEKHPDLIICAWGFRGHNMGPGVVKVLTADDVEHFVTEESYNKRDHDLTLLSDCISVGGNSDLSMTPD